MEEVKKYFKEGTEEIFLSKLSQWIPLIQGYIAEWDNIDQQDARLEQEIQKYVGNNFKSDLAKERALTAVRRKIGRQAAYVMKGSDLSGAYQMQQLIQQRVTLNVMRNQLVKKSYAILMTISEFITGEVVTYSITLFDGGEGYTFHLTMAQLFKYGLTFQGQQAVLKSNILQKLLAEEGRGIASNQIIKWDQNLSQNNSKYNLASWEDFNYGLGIAVQGQADIDYNFGKANLGDTTYNQGQILEAYMSYAQDTNRLAELSNLVALAKSQHMQASPFESLVSILKEVTNSRPFWTGGDIGNIQVKGKGASLVSYDTLKNQLKQFANLTTKALNSEIINNYVEQGRSKIDAAGRKKVQSILNNVMAGFMMLDASDFDVTDIRLSEYL